MGLSGAVHFDFHKEMIENTTSSGKLQTRGVAHSACFREAVGEGALAGWRKLKQRRAPPGPHLCRHLEFLHFPKGNTQPS
jgi:hypothetical protein